MTETNQRRLLGVIFILAGASICLIAIGVIPYDESKVHAPLWVLILCGGLFALAGIAVMLQSHPLAVNVLGNLIVLVFASVAAWVALYGASEQFSGGVPFLSHDANTRIARAVFGGGSMLCLLLLIPGVRYTLKLLHGHARDGAG